METGFVIPSLKQNVQRVRQEFRSNMPGSDAWAWPNNVNPIAKVFGGVLHELFGALDYVARQKFALTADTEGLDLHGAEYGLARRPASPARGFVTIEVNAAVAIAIGARFRRADGVELIATAGGATVGADSVEVEVIAGVDGAIGNTIADTPLEIVSGVSGDDLALAYVASNGVGAGVDVEDDETFRARILFRKRNPVHGGTASDYVQWALEVSGVSRVFVERQWAGAGTVRIYPLFDDLYADGIPAGADVARVADHIDLLRPAGAVVSVVAPQAVPVNITIDGFLPFTTPAKEAALAELRAAFRRNSRVAGNDSDVLPFLASAASFSRSWIWQAVANASGEQRHSIATPSGDVALTRGQIATLGNVTFT